MSTPFSSGIGRDLRGMRFGRLTVLTKSPVSSTGKSSHHSQWLCRCDCGQEKVSPRHNLISGKATSCGCYALEVQSRTGKLQLGRRKENARYKTAEYRIYRAMLSRCRNRNSASYSKYGAQGVVVCERWQQSFDAFLQDMGPRPSTDYSIDRIDPFGNYEPHNCRWATTKAQARNKKHSKLTEEDVEVIKKRRQSGETLKAIARDFGVHLSLISLIAKGKVWA